MKGCKNSQVIKYTWNLFLSKLPFVVTTEILTALLWGGALKELVENVEGSLSLCLAHSTRLLQQVWWRIKESTAQQYNKTFITPCSYRCKLTFFYITT
jgi:hypothetical protein